MMGSSQHHNAVSGNDLLTPKRPPARVAILTAMVAVVTIAVSRPEQLQAHEGPDPVAHWEFQSDSLRDDRLLARLGPDGDVLGEVTVERDEVGESLRFDGTSTSVEVADIERASALLPGESMTVAAWVAIDRPRDWGGIIGMIEDNGEAEKGWILGYNNESFYFGLASVGADDGNGKMTYLVGRTKFERGKLYHVVGVYNGAEMQLYVNGQLDGTSREQHGAILYPEQRPLVMAAYRDQDENFVHEGRIRDIAIYAEAATAKWAAHVFDHAQKLASLPAKLGGQDGQLDFEIEPYLQYVTKSSITVMWKTTAPAASFVQYGETSDVAIRQDAEGDPQIHEVTLTGLTSNTQYFYQANSEGSEGRVRSETLTFQTACDANTPFAFAIISDTQDNLPVARKISEMAWAQRPNFVVHPGDLVGVGSKPSDWTAEFFPSMHPLISRVCLFPVLGNHEGDAKFYYDYMSLPTPEYYYSFEYGNAEFFMVDSNRKLDPGSEQYEWLARRLAASQAKWKFVTHHHPPYSSDENDYGDLWQTNKSTRGDLRIRKACELYDKFGVDIVWNGHIHSYERTWPLRGGRPVEKNGTIYMITGGGGGGLETPGPYRNFFENNVKRDHHYCMVYINGGTLELKAFDLEGRLFDQVKLQKSVKINQEAWEQSPQAD